MDNRRRIIRRRGRGRGNTHRGARRANRNNPPARMSAHPTRRRPIQQGLVVPPLQHLRPTAPEQSPQQSKGPNPRPRQEQPKPSQRQPPKPSQRQPPKPTLRERILQNKRSKAQLQERVKEQSIRKVSQQQRTEQQRKAPTVTFEASRGNIVQRTRKNTASLPMSLGRRFSPFTRAEWKKYSNPSGDFVLREVNINNWRRHDAKTAYAGFKAKDIIEGAACNAEGQPWFLLPVGARSMAVYRALRSRLRFYYMARNYYVPPNFDSELLGIEPYSGHSTQAFRGFMNADFSWNKNNIDWDMYV